MKDDQDYDLELIDPEEDLRDARKVNRFYDRMRKRISAWAAGQGGEKGQNIAETILLAPDFFMLLTRLMLDNRVPLRSKATVVGGLAYYLLPLDFLPELLLGPIGYGDDLVLAVLIINSLLNTEPEVVLSHWSGKEDLLYKIRKVTNYAEEYLHKSVYGKIKGFFDKLK
ncbi:MAG: DUF1232 domain-containing protein [Clostridia bacterium]|nr:DUF1232 domain-containing protein [Clostridia bacterium]